MLCCLKMDYTNSAPALIRAVSRIEKEYMNYSKPLLKRIGIRFLTRILLYTKQEAFEQVSLASLMMRVLDNGLNQP